MFVQNIAVVRPLTIHGRNKLKTDCLHLETSLKIIVNDLSTIGKSYRWGGDNFNTRNYRKIY